MATQIETMEIEKSTLVSSIALLRTDLNSLTQTIKSQAMELGTLTQTVKSQAMEIQPLQAENNRLRKKDFIVQLRELCYEVQRFVCSGTECTSLGDYLKDASNNTSMNELVSFGVRKGGDHVHS